MITNQILVAYPFLSRLSAESRRLLETHGKIHLTARGTCLLRKGDRIRGLYLVVAGRLRVYTITATGEEAALYLINPGESCPLAMNALLTARLHQAWVEPESKTVKIFFVPSAIFQTLYASEPAVREFALGVLSDRISTLMTALEDLSLHSVKERVKSHLLRSANERGEVETTHQNIALALGTAREVVSRHLGELAAARLIKTQRGRITLLKPHQLG